MSMGLGIHYSNIYIGGVVIIIILTVIGFRMRKLHMTKDLEDTKEE